MVGGYPECWWGDLCLNVPPIDLTLGHVAAEVGEFTNGQWGFKGTVDVLGLGDVGFYIDESGNLDLGDVDYYVLLTPPQVQQARMAWEAAASGRQLPAGFAAPEGISFGPQGDIVVDVPIAVSTDATFALTRSGPAPVLRLIAPDGTQIDPGQLPPYVKYFENISYKVSTTAGVTGTVTAAGAMVVAPSLELGGPVVIPAPMAQRIAKNQANPPGELQSLNAPVDIASWSGSAAGSQPVAHLRFVQASPDVAAADVKVDGASLVANLGFAGVTEYTELPPGQHTVQYTASGAAGSELINTTVDLQSSTYYAVALVGRQGSREPLVLVDENRPLPETTALVRFVNLAPEAPAADLVQSSGRLSASAVPYKGAGKYVDMDAGVYDLEARVADTATALAQVAGVTLAKGGIYTAFLMAGEDGAPAMKLVVKADDAPRARVRFLNAVADGPVPVLPDGLDLEFLQPAVGGDYVGMFAAATPFTPTFYASVDPGQSLFRVKAAGAGAPVIANTEAVLEGGKDYTVVAGGLAAAVELRVVADDNAIPELGKARVRFAHLSPNTAAVDVAVGVEYNAGGDVLFTAIPYGDASNYIQVDGGAYNLEIREAGTATVLAALPGVELHEGYVYTLSAAGLAGGAPALQLKLDTDLVTEKITQTMYVVKDIPTGAWKAVLSGDPSPTADYVFSATGAAPAPKLAGVEATFTDNQAATADWRLTSAQLDTKISIFANSGPITTTLVVTNSNGMTSTMDLPLFTGQALTTNLSGTDSTWVDGSVHSQSVDMSKLPSGVYRIWVEADDGRNAPVRVYAPEAVPVFHTFPGTWAANLRAAASYRRLEVAWDRSSQPDVDRYTLYVGSVPGVAGQVIEVGDTSSYGLDALTPGQPYYLWLDALDVDSRPRPHPGMPAATP